MRDDVAHESGAHRPRVLRWMPGIRSMTGAGSPSVVRDVSAGAVLAALVVPLGMAYAPLAGLEPIAGLYASVVALIAYALFGPSRSLVLGPDSSTAPLVAAAIAPLAAAGSVEHHAFAGMLAVLVGALALIVAFTRLSFITDLLSKPVRIGYMNGVAVVIVVSQLPRLFGVPSSGEGFVGRLVSVAGSLDDTMAASLLFGVATLAATFLLRRLLPKVPVVLVVVVGATIASVVLDAARAGVSTVGVLPQGLPGFVFPAVGVDGIVSLLAGAVGIAVITLADTSVLSQSLATRCEEDPRADEEFAAVGIANVMAGLFQGFPVSGSLTRSAVNLSSGAVSHLSSLTAAALVVLMLFIAPGLLAPLPLSVLAAIVIVAGIDLAEVAGTVRLWHQRRTEFTVSVTTFAAVVFLGVLPGVFVAVALSLLNFVRRQWWPHDAVLGRAPGVKGYHDITDLEDALQIPGLLLYRFDAPLFFANARVFRERLFARLEEQERPVRRVVIAAEPLIDVDTTAADALAGVIGELREQGIEFGFAELKQPIRERLGRYGILDLVDPALIHPTIGSAVHAYVRESDVDWVDWEDEPKKDDTGASGLAEDEPNARRTP